VNIDDATAVMKCRPRGLTFPRRRRGHRIASRYRIMGIPTHYFIGRDGKIQEIRLGGLQPEDMDTFVAGIMEGRTPSDGDQALSRRAGPESTADTSGAGSIRRGPRR
jgi:hypothetical protein